MSIEPVHGPIYYTTGSLWHKAQERWALDPSQPLFVHMLHVSNEIKKKAHDEYVARVGCEPQDIEFEDLYTAIERILDLAQRYESKWETPIPDRFTLLAPEQTLVVNVPYSEHLLEGTLDGLLEETMSGKLFVLERKTYQQRPRQDVLDNTQQFIDYAYIVTHAFPEREFGGIAYDGAWITQTKHTNDELFLRTTLHRSAREIELDGIAIGLTLNEMDRDAKLCSDKEILWEDHGVTEYKTIWQPHPIATRAYRGCFDCAHQRLCEKYSKGENWQALIDTEYKSRPKQGYAIEVEE